MVYVANAESKSITVAHLAVASGELELVQTVDAGGTVMPMAVSPDRRFLFAALRSKPYALASFAIDGKTGCLQAIGQFPLPESMANIATDRSGRLLFAASYGGNLVSVSRIGADGVVAPAHQIVPTPPMAHSIQPTPDNQYVLVSSLGGDVLMRWRLDEVSGTLVNDSLSKIGFEEKSGPRHFVFHPNGKFVYLIDELDAKLHVLAYEQGGEVFTCVQTTSVVPENYTGKLAAADVHMTPDGRFLYASERGSSTLTAFWVDAQTGHLQTIASYPTEKQPRGFNIDPAGRYLVAVGQASHAASVYRIKQDGTLVFSQSYPVGRSPNWVEIIARPGK
ncbi:lactonase family protein [Uliginosibacterium gangwonense]|uniref:lactonase family protein n=1 Tax=Uliginosibacterium gangwonense TaxID=392736 RepID=UPI00037FB0C7|nr:beta-propeller fold lactonase family protein [Uliginosibacterium gangwonense]